MRHLPIDSALFANHRKRLADRLPHGAIAFANANDVLPTNADGTLPLHPNSDLLDRFHQKACHEQPSRKRLIQWFQHIL